MGIQLKQIRDPQGPRDGRENSMAAGALAVDNQGSFPDHSRHANDPLPDVRPGRHRHVAGSRLLLPLRSLLVPHLLVAGWLRLRGGRLNG